MTVDWVAVDGLVDGGGEGGGGEVSVGRNHGSQGRHGGDGGEGQGGGTGLVGPGVGGEPGGEPQVLTGAVPGGDVAPASSGAVHALTVTLSIRKYLTN